MKIVVITGSPRKNGNSFAMTDAFIQEAEKRGHTIRRFDAAFLKIGGCHACMTCYKTGKACSFDDDFNDIAPAILEADAVVFTMPVYWYSIPAQIKGAIDRLFSLVVGGKEVAGKKWALIACCEEEDTTVLDGVRIPWSVRPPCCNGRRWAKSSFRRTQRGRHRPHRRLPTGCRPGRQILNTLLFPYSSPDNPLRCGTGDFLYRHPNLPQQGTSPKLSPFTRVNPVSNKRA